MRADDCQLAIADFRLAIADWLFSIALTINRKNADRSLLTTDY